VADLLLCGWCGFETEDGWEMLTHRDTHRDDIGCNICGEAAPDAEPHVCAPDHMNRGK
jgi:hypothetical protein